MKNVLKEELKRAIYSRGMLIAILMGCAISVSQLFGRPYECYLINQEMDFSSYPMNYPATVVDLWLEGDVISLESFLFFLILPLLATLPFGTSYFTDKSNGYIKDIYMRTPRKKYLMAKYIATFFSGGMAVVVPLLVNLVGCMMLLPNLLPQGISPGNLIQPKMMFCEILYYDPTIYMLSFIIIDFILAGIFACLGLTSSFITDYKIVVLICPFFIQLFIKTICEMFLDYMWSSVYFARSGYGVQHIMILIIYGIGGILFTATVFLIKGEKEDVF